MPQKFNPGDLVELKSGGPVMTVEKASYTDKDAYHCSWFAGSKDNSRIFQAEALKKSEVE